MTGMTMIPRRALLAFALLLGALALTGSAAATVAWVQMVAGGAEIRLVTSAAACPTAKVDGAERPTRERAGPGEAFANRVCATRLRAGDRRVLVDGRALPAPRPRPQRLVILGDSGCRLKGAYVQNCRDPSGWPFARIAGLAAARKPDLVIHVGDYYYRETPCPAGNAGCAGSPYGDRWATWKAELFDPAAPLLAAAPWVFARGNHEDCKRGAAGWFRQLDAAPTVKTCPADSDTFAVDLGGPTLFVVDSNDTEDLIAPADKVASFAARLGPVRPGPAGAWIVTHRPFWDSSRLGDLVADGRVNATERAAVKARDLTGVNLLLSGHVHNFTSVSFGAPRPPQLVVGTGGDTLDLDDAPPPASGDARVDGLPAEIFTMGRFGYFVFDRRGGDWVGQFYDLHDQVAADCRLHNRALVCHAPR
jgi:Calcineurin-like phosphoesterase